jgi:hypothetical protein
MQLCFLEGCSKVGNAVFFLSLENSATFCGLGAVKLLMVIMEEIYFTKPSHFMVMVNMGRILGCSCLCCCSVIVCKSSFALFNPFL